MPELVIGTRGSKLALWQAHHIAAELKQANQGLEVSLQVIKTKGDKIQDVPLAKVGGKGLFVKEIEQALLRRDVDLAVHSIKDVPAELAEGLVLTMIPEREDPRDALVSRSGPDLAGLPQGAVVGTSSLRRRCQLQHLRPDLEVRDLRGNVDTRLAKLDRGDFDAILLACAGLRRLELAGRITQAMDPTTFVPAVGQGALGIEVRGDDQRIKDMLAPLHHGDTAVCVTAERGFLGRLGGGCQVPIAAHATLSGGEIHLDALIGHPSGKPMYRHEARGPEAEAEAMGIKLAETLLDQGAGAVLEEVYED